MKYNQNNPLKTVKGMSQHSPTTSTFYLKAAHSLPRLLQTPRTSKQSPRVGAMVGGIANVSSPPPSDIYPCCPLFFGQAHKAVITQVKWKLVAAYWFLALISFLKLQ
ncbi:Hypothetical predicted protein [Podarcis lilfordi]|uniref:Uncharacterized protein n=1 Tax=Podarcis lilfordi TaxID=74358 RepID=A0AA35JXJ6_9SAUR|nr:Hypothetical predicted protein [Podarcis lilfordi]